MTDQTPGYEHRVMRCKLDRTITVAGRRYRPGEPIEGEVPAAHAEDFELGIVSQTLPAPAAPGQRVKKVRHDPPVIVRREPVLHPAPAPIRATGLDKAKSEKDD